MNVCFSLTGRPRWPGQCSVHTPALIQRHNPSFFDGLSPLKRGSQGWGLLCRKLGKPNPAARAPRDCLAVWCGCLECCQTDQTQVLQLCKGGLFRLKTWVASQKKKKRNTVQSSSPEKRVSLGLWEDPDMQSRWCILQHGSEGEGRPRKPREVARARGRARWCRAGFTWSPRSRRGLWRWRSTVLDSPRCSLSLVSHKLSNC